MINDEQIARQRVVIYHATQMQKSDDPKTAYVGRLIDEEMSACHALICHHEKLKNAVKQLENTLNVLKEEEPENIKTVDPLSEEIIPREMKALFALAKIYKAINDPWKTEAELIETMRGYAKEALDEYEMMEITSSVIKEMLKTGKTL